MYESEKYAHNMDWKFWVCYMKRGVLWVVGGDCFFRVKKKRQFVVIESFFFFSLNIHWYIKLVLSLIGVVFVDLFSKIVVLIGVFVTDQLIALLYLIIYNMNLLNLEHESMNMWIVVSRCPKVLLKDNEILIRNYSVEQSWKQKLKVGQFSQVNNYSSRREDVVCGEQVLTLYFKSWNMFMNYTTGLFLDLSCTTVNWYLYITCTLK